MYVHVPLTSENLRIPPLVAVAGDAAGASFATYRVSIPGVPSRSAKKNSLNDAGAAVGMPGKAVMVSPAAVGKPTPTAPSFMVPAPELTYN